ncbi:hypothetical protein Y032_0003g1257 [Ancylostoma ceylanicum]|uniref:Uncharacterized protein n=1 Tax=Ancylostoma ceylanicum TaxID=53326 RepID=A0A016VWM4_9BILA|nr:hypothetical protein Y032_0003g1257 [Ancylostoma ceylanicum]
MQVTNRSASESVEENKRKKEVEEDSSTDSLADLFVICIAYPGLTKVLNTESSSIKTENMGPQNPRNEETYT